MMLRKKKDQKTKKFFTGGWGEVENLAFLKDYQLSAQLLSPIHPLLKPTEQVKGLFFTEGEFKSCFVPHLLPPESQTGYFRIVSPREDFRCGPICIIFAMTGDQGFEHRQKSYATHLAKKGISSLIYENPFYGKRKPAYQSSFCFSTVADMLTMGLCAVEEGKALVSWLHTEGCHQIGVAGLSQGAMMAASVAALSKEFPIAAACSLIAHSPEVILCDGYLKKIVDWKSVESSNFEETQYELIKVFRPLEITRLPRPLYPQATLLQGAYHDLVAPRYSVKMIHRLWPGTQLSWLPGTHITSLALHKKSFCNLIVKSFQMLPQ